MWLGFPTKGCKLIDSAELGTTSPAPLKSPLSVNQWIKRFFFILKYHLLEERLFLYLNMASLLNFWFCKY